MHETWLVCGTWLTHWWVMSHSTLRITRLPSGCEDNALLQHTATHCNTLQHTATHCNTLRHIRATRDALQLAHCNSLKRTTTQHFGCVRECKDCRVAVNACVVYERECKTHCNTLQHTATHCNTLQHVWVVYECECKTCVAWLIHGLKNCRVAVRVCVGRDSFMNGQFEDVAHVVGGGDLGLNPTGRILVRWKRRDLGCNDADCQKFTHVLVPIIELFVEWDQESASKI